MAISTMTLILLGWVLLELHGLSVAVDKTGCGVPTVSKSVIHVSNGGNTIIGTTVTGHNGASVNDSFEKELGR